MNVKKLWIAFIVVTVVSFAVLGYFGTEIYHKAPPIPDRVVDCPGHGALHRARTSARGRTSGSRSAARRWGASGATAPTWRPTGPRTGSIARRRSSSTCGRSRSEGVPYDRLPPEAQTLLRARLKEEIRTNTYDPSTRVITVSTDRAAAITAVSAHYAALFGADTDPEIVALRKAYAIPAESIKTPERLHQINAFFFWTAWSCGTNRPGSSITYTNNWPAEPLIDNAPTASIMLWSVVSMVVLLAGIGGIVWIYARPARAGGGPRDPR